VTGTSIANLMALLIARTDRLGQAVRKTGLTQSSRQLIAYTSAGAHICVSQAMDLAGLGCDALRAIAVDSDFRIDIKQLKAAIQADQAAGLEPFLIIGSAGTVDTGAIDDLEKLADIAHHEHLWFHVDGAFGALGMFAPEIAPRLTGIERADSIAFDFHKWGQVQYDAGYLLVRDGKHQLDTFAKAPTYLQRVERGMSAGSPWPCDLGPDLSRGFRALKTWFTLGTFGTEKLGRMINKTCELAQYLKRKIELDSRLELLAPVSLSIVCFRYRHGAQQESNELNKEILIELQESGVVAPSGTMIGRFFALRVAIINHRTTITDIDNLIGMVIGSGNKLSLAK